MCWISCVFMSIISNTHLNCFVIVAGRREQEPVLNISTIHRLEPSSETNYIYVYIYICIYNIYNSSFGEPMLNTLLHFTCVFDFRTGAFRLESRQWIQSNITLAINGTAQNVVRVASRFVIPHGRIGGGPFKPMAPPWGLSKPRAPKELSQKSHKSKLVAK